MGRINDGGPAFPFPSGPEPRVNEFHDRSEGMTLRDYFAAKAIGGILSDQADGTLFAKGDKTDLAKWAYEYADAMLAERAKGGGQ